MKFGHTLHINAKEIEVLCEALKMYQAGLDQKYAAKDFGDKSPQGAASYRCKVINMARTMEEIKRLPKPVASEVGKKPDVLP